MLAMLIIVPVLTIQDSNLLFQSSVQYVARFAELREANFNKYNVSVGAQYADFRSYRHS